MTPSRKVFEELENKGIRYLVAEGIRYLVAGGFALNFHQVQRATVDLDLILHLQAENVLSFIEVMKSLGFTARLPTKAEDFAIESMRKSWIEEKGMMVFSFHKPDNPLETIGVFVKEPMPFDELWKRRFEVPAFGLKIKVLGKEDLIALKRKAGKTTPRLEKNGKR